MRRIILFVCVGLLTTTLSCTKHPDAKHPSSLVGTWEGEMFQSKTYILKGDGTAWMRIPEGRFQLKWSYEEDKLTFEDQNGKKAELSVLGRTETTLTLQGVKGTWKGEVITYNRIGKN